MHRPASILQCPQRWFRERNVFLKSHTYLQVGPLMNCLVDEMAGEEAHLCRATGNLETCQGQGHNGAIVRKATQ